MVEYRLTPAAERDLEAIWDYSAEHWGADQAERYIDALTDMFVRLAGAPESAPACDAIRAGYRRRRVERHMIYFRITVYGIVVVRVLHERMDAASQL